MDAWLQCCEKCSLMFSVYRTVCSVTGKGSASKPFQRFNCQGWSLTESLTWWELCFSLVQLSWAAGMKIMKYANQDMAKDLAPNAFAASSQQAVFSISTNGSLHAEQVETAMRCQSFIIVPPKISKNVSKRLQHQIRCGKEKTPSMSPARLSQAALKLIQYLRPAAHRRCPLWSWFELHGLAVFFLLLQNCWWIGAFKAHSFWRSLSVSRDDGSW